MWSKEKVRKHDFHFIALENGDIEGVLLYQPSKFEHEAVIKFEQSPKGQFFVSDPYAEQILKDVPHFSTLLADLTHAACFLQNITSDFHAKLTREEIDEQAIYYTFRYADDVYFFGEFDPENMGEDDNDPHFYFEEHSLMFRDLEINIIEQRDVREVLKKLLKKQSKNRLRYLTGSIN